MGVFAMASHSHHDASRLGLARPPEPAGGRRGVSPGFQKVIERHQWKGRSAVDIGCGTGAATLLLSRLGANALGVDLDPEAVALAAERADAEGVSSARFVCADAEAVDYRALLSTEDAIDGVVAHLCFSDRIAKRAAQSLRPGGVFIVRSFHKDMWKEVGFDAPFAFSVAQMRALLGRLGFKVTALNVERRTQRFDSLEDFMEKFLSDPARRAHWQEDGRLRRMKAIFDRGGHSLSEAFLLVEAVKQPPRAPVRRPAKKPRKARR